MIGAAAAYMSGLFFASFFTGPMILAVVAAAVLVLVIFGKRRGFKTADYAVIAAAFTAAFAVFNVYTLMYHDKVVVYDGKTGSFTGEVTDISVHDGGNASYILKGRTGDGQKARITYYGSDLGAEYGDTVTIGQCRFSLPDKDWLFDAETYYKAQGVFLSAGNIKDAVCTHRGRRPLKNALISYREHMIKRFNAVLGTECGGFLAGMVFGEKQGLDNNTKTALYRSGIGHILAVSGLHVSIIAALLMTLLRRLRVNRFAAFGIMDAVLVLLVVMANTPVSAVRAAIMMNFMYSASLFRRQNDPLNSLAAASLLICLFRPYSIYSAGFMLSLSGTFGIAVFAPFAAGKRKYSGVWGKLRYALIAGICTAVSVFPLTMLYFDETSLISPLTNLLLVPLCTIAMVIGVVYLLTGGLLPILPSAGGLISIVLHISGKLSRIGIFHASRSGELVPVLLLTAGTCVVLIYFYTGRRRAVIAATAVSAAVFAFGYMGIGLVQRSRLTVAVLGKGYNTAAVVTCKGRTDVIDLSGHYREAAYVRKYLSINGADHVDSLILGENVQSQYAAYKGQLEFFPAEKCMVSGEVPVAGGEDCVNFGNDAVRIDNGTYIITYADGCLTVESGGKRVDVVPVGKDTDANSELTVFYGNVGKKTNVTVSRSMYLDEVSDGVLCSMNNTEIVFGETIKIRRL
ncbi:ComEC/Rec2 family competence protein [Ruminococcus sp. XPD3002]|uniref:ComEC/Rec2 family competence protein n=1 Tax=Ruminococcus sp. XPD3002 TaxID=1452269 RepID=UPI00094DDDD8